MSSNPNAADDEELLRMLPQMDSALGGGGAAAVGAKGSAASAAAVDPCVVYKKIKPFLPILIKAVKKIPVIGTKAALALTILQQIGDKCCK